MIPHSLLQASAERRHARRPHPRTSNNFSKMDVLGGPRPRPILVPDVLYLDRPGRFVLVSALNVIVQIILEIDDLVLARVSDVLVFGRPKIR